MAQLKKNKIIINFNLIVEPHYLEYKKIDDCCIIFLFKNKTCRLQ